MDNEKKHVIVDTDTGVDDALALAFLANRSDVELVAIHSTHGNVLPEQAANNARYVLETCGRGDIDVHIGAPPPDDCPIPQSNYVHGDDGLGNTWVQPKRPVTGKPDAPENLVTLANDNPGKLDLLGLGACTNIGQALRIDPDLFQKLHSVIIFGSLGPALFQDQTPWADRRFRVGRDPNGSHDIQAAASVARTPGPVTWCGPYLARQCLLPEQLFIDIAQETKHPVAELIPKISKFYADFYTKSYQQETRIMGINDSITAAVMVEPGLILGSVQRPLEVFQDEEGVECLAAVHAKPGSSQPRHRIVFDVDFYRITDMVTESLRHPIQ